DANIQVLKIPPRSPQANGYAERFVRTVGAELSDRILIFGQRHLQRVLDDYVSHYNEQRPHRGRGLRPPSAVQLALPTRHPRSFVIQPSAASSTNIIVRHSPKGATTFWKPHRVLVRIRRPTFALCRNGVEVGVLEGVAAARLDYRLGLLMSELGKVKHAVAVWGKSSRGGRHAPKEGRQLTPCELLRVGDATPTAVARAGRRALSRLSTAARRVD
ncbi:MAG: integrase catalytic region, partial [Pseudonocardiales bacterium]|nr:integrase catalytic region [Pseudonocardiales bacterium]